MSFKWHVRERIVAKVLLSSQKIESGTSSSFYQCGAFTEEVRLGRGEFFLSSLFSLLFPRKKHLNFQKNNNCILRFVILSILILLLIIIYLDFDSFLRLNLF